MSSDASLTLSGKVGTVGFKKHRRFFQTTVKFGEIRNFVERRLYNGATGQGEQRALIPANVSRLTKAIKNDEYTPTSWSLSLKKKHIDNAIFHDDGTVILTIHPDNPIPLTDGGHRDNSYERIYEELMEAEDEQNQEKIMAVENQDVPLIVYIDGGDPKEDFLNLNSGRPVDRAHMLSLQIRKGVITGKDEAALKIALDVAKILNSDKPERSWLTNYILFDSRKDNAPKLAMPITTLLGRGSSDIAGSIVGGARIAIEWDKDKDWLASVYRMVYNIILENAPDLLKPGKLLTPPPDGTKAGATLMIAIGNCVAYYMARKELNSLSEEEADTVVEAAKLVFDTDAKGKTSADAKRQAIGSFAMEYFSEYNTEEEEGVHEGIPIGLIEILSSGTFGVSKLPKKTGDAS